jgi:hypothetical protein
MSATHYLSTRTVATLTVFQMYPVRVSDKITVILTEIFRGIGLPLQIQGGTMMTIHQRYYILNEGHLNDWMDVPGNNN